MENNNNDLSKRLTIFNIILLIFNIIYYVYIFSLVKTSIGNQWVDIKENNSSYSSSINLADNSTSFIIITVACIVAALIFLIMSTTQKKKVLNIFLSVLNIVIDVFLVFILMKF